MRNKLPKVRMARRNPRFVAILPILVDCGCFRRHPQAKLYQIPLFEHCLREIAKHPPEEALEHARTRWLIGSSLETMTRLLSRHGHRSCPKNALYSRISAT